MNSTAEMVTPHVRRTNLKRACGVRGLGAKDLVGLAGMKGTYQYWHDLLTTDKSFGANKAREIERALNLPTHWLESPHDPEEAVPSAPSSPIVAEEQRPPYAIERRKNPSYVPPPGLVALRVMDVEASMGHGVSQPGHENVVMNMVVNEQWLRRHASFSSPENLAIVTGVGDSMQPLFEDGDPLLVDRGVTEIKLDAIYVLALNEELYIKRVQRRPDGTFMMISDNKAYEGYHVKGSERERFRVLGRVVMAWNSRRI